MTTVPSAESLIQKLALQGVHVPAGNVRVDSYGDSPALSKQLIDLIRFGPKRAGTSLLWTFEFEREGLPQKDDIEIVIDHENEPVLLTRLTSVAIVAFNEVSDAYAAIEGEGDGSLEYWRAGHWAFFSRECARIGRAPTQQMPVVCSIFELLAIVPPSTN